MMVTGSKVLDNEPVKRFVLVTITLIIYQLKKSGDVLENITNHETQPISSAVITESG